MSYNVYDEELNKYIIQYAKESDISAILKKSNTYIYGVRFVTPDHKVIGYDLNSNKNIEYILKNITIDKSIEGFILIIQSFSIDDDLQSIIIINRIGKLPHMPSMHEYFKNTFYNTNTPDIDKSITNVCCKYGSFYTDKIDTIWVRFNIKSYMLYIDFNYILICGNIGSVVYEKQSFTKSDFGLLSYLNMTTKEFCEAYRVGYSESKHNGKIPMERVTTNIYYESVYNKYFNANIIKSYKCPYNQNLIEMWFDFNNLMINLQNITRSELDTANEVIALINEVGDDEWNNIFNNE